MATDKARKQAVRRDATQMIKDARTDLLKAQVRASREGRDMLEEVCEQARKVLGDGLKVAESQAVDVAIPD